jgi:hypothetical protein
MALRAVREEADNNDAIAAVEPYLDEATQVLRLLLDSATLPVREQR